MRKPATPARAAGISAGGAGAVVVTPVDDGADGNEDILLAHHGHQRGAKASTNAPPTDHVRRTCSHTDTNSATANAEHACENGGATYM